MKDIKIVLVDDDEITLEIYTELLRDLQTEFKIEYKIISFNNTKQAIEFFENNKCSILITDYNIDGNNGDDILEVANGMYSYAIGISAQPSQFQLRQQLDLCIQKPATLSFITAGIRSMTKTILEHGEQYRVYIDLEPDVFHKIQQIAEKEGLTIEQIVIAFLEAQMELHQ